MLTVDEYARIRRAYRDGMKIREIAREFHHSRRKVREALAEPEPRRYPRELLPWQEGSTQVDLTIRWENPPTTVYIEAKYGSDLSTTTAGNSGHHG